MATVSYGSDETYREMVYGKTCASAIQFVQNQFNQIPTNLSEMGREWYARQKETFLNFENSSAARLAAAAARKIRGMMGENCIRPLCSLADLQQAPTVMQRYVMAQPDVRTLYNRGMCEGYVDTYTDLHPGTVGENHYDYRRVMNGIVVAPGEFDEVTSESTWHATTYDEDLLPDDNELEFDEQVDILQSWDTIRNAILHGKDDPTSAWNAEL
jgi:hypothetical protein